MLFQERKDLTVLLTSVRRIHGRQFGVHRAPRGDLVWRVVDARNLLSTTNNESVTPINNQHWKTHILSIFDGYFSQLFASLAIHRVFEAWMIRLEFTTRTQYLVGIDIEISDFARKPATSFETYTHTKINQTNKQKQLQINIKLILSMINRTSIIFLEKQKFPFFHNKKQSDIYVHSVVFCSKIRSALVCFSNSLRNSSETVPFSKQKTKNKKENRKEKIVECFFFLLVFQIWNVFFNIKISIH